jgi:hypothetical protein
MAPTEDKSIYGCWGDLRECDNPRFSFVRDTKEVSHLDEDGAYLVPRVKRITESLFLNLVAIGTQLNAAQRSEIEQCEFAIVEEYELSKCNPDDPRLFRGYVLERHLSENIKRAGRGGVMKSETIDQMAAVAFNDGNHARKPYEELPEEWKEVWRSKMRAALAVFLREPPAVAWECFCDEAYFHGRNRSGAQVASCHSTSCTALRCG